MANVEPGISLLVRKSNGDNTSWPGFGQSCLEKDPQIILIVI